MLRIPNEIAVFVKYFLFCRERIPMDGTCTSEGIFFTQEGYANKLLNKSGLKQSKKCATIETNTRLRSDGGPLLQIPNLFKHLLEVLYI